MLVCTPALAQTPPAKLSFPALTGRVVDAAHVLPPDLQAQLTAELAALEQKSGDQLVVVTVPSLQGQAIEDYGYQLGRAWGLGAKGKDNGALFIVAPGERKVRIEVGYGLEPVLTDAVSSVILNTEVLPRFRAGDIPGGVKAGTDALVHELGLDPAQAQAAAQQAEAPSADANAPSPGARGHSAFGGAVSLLILIFVLSAFFRGGRRGGGAGWILPLMFMGSAFGGRDRDDDWGGGGDGGGFGGGGGSFGGGGASGGW